MIKDTKDNNKVYDKDLHQDTKTKTSSVIQTILG